MAMRVYLNGDVVEVDKTSEPLLQINRINCGYKIIGQNVTIYDLTDSTASRFDDASNIRDQANTVIGDLYDVVKYLSGFIYYGETAPDTSPLGGIVTDAKNIGTGAEIFKQKVDTDLELRKLNSNDFDVTQNADDVSIDASADMINNQASTTPVAGMKALVEDSGTLKQVDVIGFLGGGGGGGHEPYIGNTLLNTLDLAKQTNTNNLNISSYSGFAVGVPFILQKDVNLFSFIVIQSNSSSVGLTAKFGIFKYTGNSGAFTPPYVFTKEYQHPTDINAGITGNQTFTLSTPFTFTAGDVYMCIIVHDTPTLGQFDANKPAYSGRRTLGQSNIIGYNPSNLSQVGRTLQTNTNATISGGNIASTINFDIIGQGNFAATPLIYLDIENA